MNDKQKRILFADDDDDLRFAVKEHFSDSSWKWDFAENGVVALDLALKHRYDLIILDVKMPFMKGNEAARDIKMKWPDVPIIAFTALPDFEERQKIMKDGFSEVISKPVALKIFQKTIEAHLYPERNPPKPEISASPPPPKESPVLITETSPSPPSPQEPPPVAETPSSPQEPSLSTVESSPPAPSPAPPAQEMEPSSPPRPEVAETSAPPEPPPSDASKYSYAFLRNKPVDYLIMTIQRLEKERRSLEDRLQDLEESQNHLKQSE